MGWLYRAWFIACKEWSPNTVIVTSVAAGNDVAVISWDSLQKGHRKDARSQERRLRRETQCRLSTQVLYKKPALADRQCKYITYTVGHQVVLLLTAENEKDSVEKTLSMTIYVLREAGSCSQHVGSAAVHNSFSPSLVSLPFSAF